VKDGVGGSAGRLNARNGVQERVFGADIARFELVFDGFHDHFAAVGGDIVLAFVHLRDHGGVHGADADHLHDGGHGVGGELSAAGARRRGWQRLRYQ
jgi:hypothetical protein